MKTLKRNEIPMNQTWNLDDLFTSRDELKAFLPTLEQQADKIAEYKGAIISNAKTLLNCILDVEKFYIDITRAGTYSSLNTSTDATDTTAQEDMMIFGAMASKINAQLIFIETELMELTKKKLDSFIQEEPQLEVYKKYILDLLKQKEHMLHPETEKVLASLGQLTGSPYNVYGVSKGADMVFEDIIDDEGNAHPNSFPLFEGTYEFTQDTSLRRKAYASFNKTLKQYNNTFAALYNTEVNKQVTLAKLRGYSDVFEMLLNAQDVTREMYNRQIDVIYKELSPHMRKYARLIKQELKLDKVMFCDLKAPIDTTFNPDATYEDTKELILESLNILGEEYMENMHRAFDERWIDYAQNVGKRTGAFCASPYGVHPYVFVTFQNKMRDAFTLAHELGHAGHFALAGKEQVFFNTRSSMYTIEAPSTMNELLLGNHMLNTNDDPKMKKFVISEFLGTYYHNFVTHLLEAHYQRKVYELAEKGTPLTAPTLNNLKLDTLRGFWGDDVEIDDDAGMTWMRQPHYYMGLYPYTYSAGLTASTAVAAQIFSGNKEAVSNWINYLKEGGSKQPLDLLRTAGMDLSTDKPVQDAVAYVGSLIDELVELYK